MGQILADPITQSQFEAVISLKTGSRQAQEYNDTFLIW